MFGSESTEPDLSGVCAAWLGDRDVVIEPTVSDGFSGSRLFQVRCSANAAWMLKSCAAGAADRIGWAHGLMRHLRVAGIREVPAVMATPDGRTLVIDGWGTAWELVEHIAGIIDFHAAGVDTPATDMARLIGSWRPEADADTPLLHRWAEAVAAYESSRPLSISERNLIPWLLATGVLFGLDNWFRWLLAESRDFLRPARALRRIDHLLSQLPAAVCVINERVGNAI